MELDEAIARRRMTRSFAARPVDPEVLERILATVLRAPSAGFAQGVDLLVLTESSARARFWELATDAAWRSGGAHAAGLLAAPVLVLPVADPVAYLARYAAPDKVSSGLGNDTSTWSVPYWTVDAAFVVMQLLLASTAAGLGALFFRLHAPPSVVLTGLGAPEDRETIGAVALGHPDGEDRRTSPATRRRRTLDEVVHRERW